MVTGRSMVQILVGRRRVGGLLGEVIGACEHSQDQLNPRVLQIFDNRRIGWSDVFRELAKQQLVGSL